MIRLNPFNPRSIIFFSSDLSRLNTKQSEKLALHQGMKVKEVKKMAFVIILIFYNLVASWWQLKNNSEQQGEKMLSIDQQTWNRAKSSLDQAVSLHLFDPNVSHIDLGLKIYDSENYRIEEKLVVRVHLRKKLSGDAFKAFADQYPDRVISAAAIGFEVDVPEARYQLHNYRRWWWGFNSNGRARMFDVMKGGISISREDSYGYGTLGGKVRDRQSGDEYLLSNWHVLVGSWDNAPGMAIYQPAAYNGGTRWHTVANLSRDAMKSNIDAAIAKLNNRRSLVNEQLEVGKVNGATEPELGRVVIKSGCSSRVTQGLISGINGQTVIRYDGMHRVIKHIVHIAPVVSGSEVSAAGDSGSWWLEKDSRLAVGLHFAGSNQPEYGLAISMPAVLNSLNVEIA